MFQRIRPEKTIEIAKYFSWLSFSMIIASSVVLTVFLGRSTLTSIIDSQKEYLTILSDNFNSQLFRRFTLPIALAEDEVSLRDPSQYRLLNEIVEGLISGLEINEVRILDINGIVAYSTEYDEIQSNVGHTDSIQKLFKREIPLIFNETNALGYMEAFFSSKIENDSFMLEVLFPLSVDSDLAPYFQDDSILGVLQISVDVTRNYKDAINNQRVIFAIFSASSLILFILLQYIARKSEILIQERMEKNKQLEAQLHQQEKLASMGRVVASIAHEIRNPLGIIQSSTELLRSRNKDILDNPSRRILDATLDETKRLGEVVNDFLDYARPRTPKFKNVDISFSIKKALAFLDNKIKTDGVDVQITMNDAIIVQGEEEILYRAIYNVISNALQALEEEDRKILSISVIDNDEFTEIKISDSGKGFSEEALSKALDPFFTTKETGTGLGLPIVKSIIEAHNGVLTLSNNEEGGACVSISFNKKNN